VGESAASRVVDEAGCDAVMPEQKEIARRIGVGRLRPMGTGQGCARPRGEALAPPGRLALPGWLVPYNGSAGETPQVHGWFVSVTQRIRKQGRKKW